MAAEAEQEEGEDEEDEDEEEELDLSSISVSKPIPIPNSPRTPRRRGRTYTAPRVVKSALAPPFFPSEQDIDDNIFFYMSMR